MSATLSLTERACMTALRGLLLSVLPAGVPVVRGQVNRVPEPHEKDFVVVTPLLRTRLSTTVSAYNDCELTGYISEDTLIVESVLYGVLQVGSPLFAADILPGTRIVALGTGTGGVGSYVVSPRQTVQTSAIWAGLGALLQPVEASYQLDIHGPGSADNAQILSTIFYSSEAFDFFRDTGLDVRPLYASDPREAPFIGGEDQYENRWTVDAVLQVNSIVSLSQQFADQLHVDLFNVEATFPV